MTKHRITFSPIFPHWSPPSFPHIDTGKKLRAMFRLDELSQPRKGSIFITVGTSYFSKAWGPKTGQESRWENGKKLTIVNRKYLMHQQTR